MFNKNMRLKSSTLSKSIETRLAHKPEIMEFHLFDSDIFQPENLIKKIRDLQNQGIKVYLHQPQKFKGEYLDILSSDQEMIDFYMYSTKVLAEVCQQTTTHCIIHAQYTAPTIHQLSEYESKTKKMYSEIEAIESQYPGVFFWEHVMGGLFTPLNPYLIDSVIKPLNLSLCFDISHIFIAFHGNNAKLLEELIRYKKWICYYHVVDSLGKTHDGLPLGEGLIDWERIVPYLNTDFIFEIALPNVFEISPMLKSVEYYNNLLRNTSNLNLK